MSDKRDKKVVDLSFWREAQTVAPEPEDDGAGGGPPIGPPGGDGSTPKPIFGSEDMLSEELSKELGEDWKCAWPGGVWYRWDGQRWDNRQGDFLIRQKAQLIARRIAAPVVEQRLARQICRKATINAAIAFAASNERHAVFAGEFDREGDWEINTQHGLLFLKTGFIVPHIRARLLTRLTGATPSPEATCPRWLQFLDEATGGDEELQDYLQRVAGYFLTGTIEEHAIFFLFGKSRTGKTVFLTIMAVLLGDYAISASMDMFIQSDGQRHPTELVDLKGPRLVIASETQEGKKWNDALLKQIAGGDKLRAHRMRQDPIEFSVNCKLGLAGNHRPRIRLGDDGMHERFRVIPFRHRQPVLDKNLVDKLKEELPGIFKWALEGEMKRQRDNGLTFERTPKAVKEATDEYFEAEDMIKRWIDSCCILGPQHRALTEELYKNFKLWSDRAGERFPPSMNMFAQKLGQLDELGIEKGWRDPGGRRGFRGLALARGQAEFTL